MLHKSKAIINTIMTILIDGNNLIHKSDNLKKQFLKDKTASQLSLIETVYSKVSRTDKVIIVFDGFGNFKKTGVLFSEKDTADNIIRRKIEKFADHKKLKVVSSDNEIMRLAKVCGCIVQKSEEFWKSINTVKFPTEKDNINHLIIEKPNNISKKDMEYYKKMFS